LGEIVDVREPHPPSPDEATTPAEFVAAMKQLRLWSGLTYRQLEGKAKAAGYVLPSSTTATMLGRSTLPREAVITAFVHACGLDAEAEGRWIVARRRIASRPQEPPAPAPEAVTPTPTPALQRKPPWRLLIPVAAVILIAGVVVAVLTNTGSSPGPSASPPPTDAPAGRQPAAGWSRIRPAHTMTADLCLTEGRERDGSSSRPIAAQQPCAQATPPRTSLQPLGDGIFRIWWNHPRHGPGCLTVMDGGKGQGYRIEPWDDCPDTRDFQKFRVEPVDTPLPGGYRLRPVHSDLCIGFADPDAVVGAEANQEHCTGAADQEFMIEKE
jgi:hypothetical protein